MKAGIVLLIFMTGCGQGIPTTPIIVYVPVPGPSGSPGISPSPIPGPMGQPGVQGIPGLNASPTTIVQLCGSCVAQYPSTFPEVGLCINGNLYGVYSLNGGFMTLIIPGTYSSDGVNCTCNLSVQSNCVVTQD